MNALTLVGLGLPPAAVEHPIMADFDLEVVHLFTGTGRCRDRSQFCNRKLNGPSPRLLHLQQICSKFSPNGCSAKTFRRRAALPAVWWQLMDYWPLVRPTGPFPKPTIAAAEYGARTRQF